MLYYLNEDYINSIANELITLDDFIPFTLIPTKIVYERNMWLKNNNKQVIMDLNRLYKRKFRVLAEPGTELNHNIFVMEQDKEFIEDHPEYSDMILDREKFESELAQMKMELSGEV